MEPPTDTPEPEADDDAPSRLSRTIGQAKETATRTQHRVVAAREHSTPIDVGFRMYEHDRAVGGGVLSAAIAFRLFLYLVPIIFLLSSVVGLGSKAASKSPEDVAKTGGIGGILAQAFTGTKSLSLSSQIVVGLTALYATYSAANSVVKVLNTAHGLIWKVPPIKLKKAAAPAFMGLTVLMLAMTTLLGHLREAAPAPGVALTLASIAVPLVLWWWVCTKLPHGDAPDWALVPGAVLLAVSVQLLHVFTVYYVARQVSGKSQTYGIIGVALSVLAWCYLLGRLIIAASALNHTLWQRTKERLGDDVPSADIPQIAGRLGFVRGMAQSARSLFK